MTNVEQWKVLFVFGPIIALLVLGGWLTVRSGVVGLATGQGARRMVENFSRAVVLTALCLGVLAVMQQLIGFPVGTAW